MPALRWIAAAAALSTAVVTMPAAAVTPTTFGSSSVVVNVPPPPYLSTATLPDGAVGVAWSDGFAVYLKLRKPGALNFSSTMTYSGSGIYDAPVVSGPGELAPITLKPLTSSTFLVGWTECTLTYTDCRVVAATVPSRAASFPTPTVVSGTQDVANAPSAFATQPDGSAAAGWWHLSPSGWELTVNRRVGIAGAWGALTPASVAGISTSTPSIQVSIDSAQSVTAMWLVQGPQDDIAVRTRVGSSSWGVKTIVSSFHSGLAAPYALLSGIASSRQGSVVAAVSDLAGSSVYAPDPVATGINVLTLAPGSSQWKVAATGVTGPGRYAVEPMVAMAPNGGAVVQFADLATSTDQPPSTDAQVTTLALQRASAGASWSAPTILDSVDTNDPIANYVFSRWQPTLLPDGTYATPVPTPVRYGGSTIGLGAGLVVRSGWSGNPALVAVSKATAIGFPVGGEISATGRASLLSLDTTVGKFVALTSALTKPAPYSGPTLSRVPKKGVAVTCSVVWAEATGAPTYRWLRNGSVISGATGASYKPRAADVGSSLTCRSSATNSKGTRIVTSPARKVGV